VSQYGSFALAPVRLVRLDSGPILCLSLQMINASRVSTKVDLPLRPPPFSLNTILLFCGQTRSGSIPQIRCRNFRISIRVYGSRELAANSGFGVWVILNGIFSFEIMCRDCDRAGSLASAARAVAHSDYRADRDSRENLSVPFATLTIIGIF